MHKFTCDQEADKLSTPRPRRCGRLDTLRSVFPRTVRFSRTRGTQVLHSRWIFAGELWAVEFNLGFTSDIVPPWLSSYWGQVCGVRQRGVFSL